MIEQFYDLRPRSAGAGPQGPRPLPCAVCPWEEIRDYNQLKMLRAFTDCGVEGTPFLGVQRLRRLGRQPQQAGGGLCPLHGAEAALVRPQFMSGTHTLTVALFGLLRTGNTLLAATGRPYDTLEGVIGIGDAGKGLRHAAGVWR